jgi:hypothetical protein
MLRPPSLDPGRDHGRFKIVKACRFGSQSDVLALGADKRVLGDGLPLTVIAGQRGRIRHMWEQLWYG